MDRPPPIFGIQLLFPDLGKDQYCIYGLRRNHLRGETPHMRGMTSPNEVICVVGACTETTMVKNWFNGDPYSWTLHQQFLVFSNMSQVRVSKRIHQQFLVSGISTLLRDSATASRIFKPMVSSRNHLTIEFLTGRKIKRATMIEARGEVRVNQWEDGNNLHTVIHVDVAHRGAHDLVVDLLIRQVAVIMQALDERPCHHVWAYKPEQEERNLGNIQPRERYCILCETTEQPAKVVLHPLPPSFNPNANLGYDIAGNDICMQCGIASALTMVSGRQLCNLCAEEEGR